MDLGVNISDEDLVVSDEDDDLLDFFEYERRPYIVKDRLNPFAELDDVDFIRRFRLSKPSVLVILEQIEETLETPTDW